MDRIYEDFTNKLLPQIQAGLTITKDYFMDLFARDIKYLIITDSLSLFVCLILVIVGTICLVKGIKAKNTGHEWLDGSKDWGGGKSVLIFSGIACLMIGIVGGFLKVDDLVKDFYLPELRIYEQMRTYNSPLN